MRTAYHGRWIVPHPRNQIAHTGKPQARNLWILHAVGKLVNRARHESVFDKKTHRVGNQFVTFHARKGPTVLRNFAWRHTARRTDRKHVLAVTHIGHRIGNRRPVTQRNIRHACRHRKFAVDAALDTINYRPCKAHHASVGRQILLPAQPHQRHALLQQKIVANKRLARQRRRAIAAVQILQNRMATAIDHIKNHHAVGACNRLRSHDAHVR